MKTIIQIEKETAKALKKLKSTKLETYDEIIKRLIEDANHNKNN
jgi:predicted CopG family antitoxin